MGDKKLLPSVTYGNRHGIRNLSRWTGLCSHLSKMPGYSAHWIASHMVGREISRNICMPNLLFEHLEIWSKIWAGSVNSHMRPVMSPAHSRAPSAQSGNHTAQKRILDVYTVELERYYTEAFQRPGQRPPGGVVDQRGIEWFCHVCTAYDFMKYVCQQSTDARHWLGLDSTLDPNEAQLTILTEQLEEDPQTLSDLLSQKPVSLYHHDGVHHTGPLGFWVFPQDVFAEDLIQRSAQRKHVADDHIADDVVDKLGLFSVNPLPNPASNFFLLIRIPTKALAGADIRCPTIFHGKGKLYWCASLEAAGPDAGWNRTRGLSTLTAQIREAYSSNIPWNTRMEIIPLGAISGPPDKLLTDTTDGYDLYRQLL
ncbi:MAG TPA: hypothetical protein VGL38_14775 [bacterium]|jgi:hypothetical protein